MYGGVEVSAKYCESTRMSTAKGGTEGEGTEEGKAGRREERGEWEKKTEWRKERGVERVSGKVDWWEMRDQRRRRKHQSSHPRRCTTKA